MAPEANALEVSFVGRAAEIDALAWRECFRPPLEGLSWYLTLESSELEDQFRFSYAVVLSGRRIVAIAPCFLHDVPISLVAPPMVALVLQKLSKVFPRLGRQRTFFIGSPCADEGTIGLAPGADLSRVLGCLKEAALARARDLAAPMIVFKDFPAADVPMIAGTGGYRATLSYPGTRVALPPQGKDAFYRSLTHTHRHNYLKKLRRSHAVIRIKTEATQHLSDQELAEVFGLFTQTYQRGRTKFERLGPSFFASVSRQPESWFILLREECSGSLAAFMLVFVLGDRVINKFIGLDYSRDPKASLYFRLFDAALDFAYLSKAREIQSGQTGYRAKLDLGHQLVPLFNVFHHANPVVHAIFRLIGERVSWRALDPDLDVWLKAHPGDYRQASIPNVP